MERGSRQIRQAFLPRAGQGRINGREQTRCRRRLPQGGNMRRIVAMGLAILVSGCAVDRFDGDGLVPGQATRAEVEKAMGVPADTRAGAAGETVLWYPRLPYGRVSYAARIGKDDKLIAVEQRLTREYLD